MELIELFPTVILGTDLSSEFDFKEIETFLLECPTKDHGLLSEGESSHDVVNVLDMEFFQPLKEKIQSIVYDYSHEIGIYPTEISSSWHNLMRKNGTLLPHRHELSVITGALYVNGDEGSSDLFLESPTECLRMCERNIANTRYSKRHETVKSKTGLLILFPSWLKHGSIDNFNPNRMVISFNTKVATED